MVRARVWRRGVRPAAALAVLALTACAELGIEVPGLAVGEASDARAVAGLKEALRIGAERGVARASRPGGYLEDPQLRIPLPDSLETAAKGLHALGLGSAAADLEVAMNRAAERAAGEATPVLWTAVSELTIRDAAAIVRGPDDAATAYLRARTGEALRARFSPIVASAMREVDVYAAYEGLARRLRILEIVSDVSGVDLERYVTDAALEGLFTLLADEERRIRTDPAARTTALLRQVFGSG